MCLAIPMTIIEINGFDARCMARGIERTVSLFLMQHERLKAGDIVMVHRGNAIARITKAEAQTAWQLYDEMLDAQEEAPAGLVPLNKADIPAASELRKQIRERKN